MGAGLALWHNAHRQRELAELLLQGPRTMAELADGLGVSVNDAEHILARLRGNGLPVAIVEDLDHEPRYRILYPNGRVCAAPGCGTLLRRSNPSDRCELHRGGALRLLKAPWPPRAPHATPRPQSAPVAFPDGAALRAARERRRLSVRQLAALAELSPAYLSRLERGTRRLSPAIAAHLEAVLAATEPSPVNTHWRAMREREGLSLREVARRAGVDCSVLSRVERGERRATRDVSVRLARALRTPVMQR